MRSVVPEYVARAASHRGDRTAASTTPTIAQLPGGTAGAGSTGAGQPTGTWFTGADPSADWYSSGAAYFGRRSVQQPCGAVSLPSLRPAGRRASEVPGDGQWTGDRVHRFLVSAAASGPS